MHGPCSPRVKETRPATTEHAEAAAAYTLRPAALSRSTWLGLGLGLGLGIGMGVGMGVGLGVGVGVGLALAQHGRELARPDTHEDTDRGLVAGRAAAV